MCGRAPGAVHSSADRGSAVAEYALVSALVAIMFMAAFQLGLALYVRNTLIADAAEGARYGARADSTPGQGAARARALITDGLSSHFAGDVSAARVSDDGVQVVKVTVVAPMPVVGPWGPGEGLRVSARAYAEDQ